MSVCARCAQILTDGFRSFGAPSWFTTQFNVALGCTRGAFGLRKILGWSDGPVVRAQLQRRLTPSRGNYTCTSGRSTLFTSSLRPGECSESTWWDTLEFGTARWFSWSCANLACLGFEAAVLWYAACYSFCMWSLSVSFGFSSLPFIYVHLDMMPWCYHMYSCVFLLCNLVLLYEFKLSNLLACSPLRPLFCFQVQLVVAQMIHLGRGPKTARSTLGQWCQSRQSPFQSCPCQQCQWILIDGCAVLRLLSCGSPWLWFPCFRSLHTKFNGFGVLLKFCFTPCLNKLLWNQPSN